MCGVRCVVCAVWCAACEMGCRVEGDLEVVPNAAVHNALVRLRSCLVEGLTFL